MQTRLRIGLLLDSLFLPAWAFTAVERTLNQKCAELVVVVLNQARPVSEPVPCFYRTFNALDAKLFVRGQNALARVDGSKILSNIPVIQVEPITENRRQRFSPADVAAIESFHPDILVKMGFGKLHGDILSVAVHGVWAYRWGDPRKIEDGLAGFWEVARGWGETGAALQQLKDNQQPNVTLFESWFFTYPYSPARSRNYILWAAASFLPRQVERLHRLGGETYFQEMKKADEDSKALHPNRPPSNLATLQVISELAVKNLAEIFRRSLYREQWELLFRYGQNAEVDISAFKKISPPQDRFWADPHLIYREPNYYIFVEEYLYRAKKGHISVIEIDRQGSYKQSVPVLQANCHLSFPCVFEWQGCYYLIPESSEQRTIDLYECISFPDHWKLKMTLMKDVKAVDTTVVYRGGKWWLFTAMAQQEAAAPQVELFLFYSDTLFTDQWQPHPMNPIVSDVKKARAAGSVFQNDGCWLRPSQYCSSTYGYGFDLSEIVTLSETEYRERTVTSVRTDWATRVIATHTYAKLGDLTVIDALTRRFRWTKTT